MYKVKLTINHDKHNEADRRELRYQLTGELSLNYTDMKL